MGAAVVGFLKTAVLAVLLCAGGGLAARAEPVRITFVQANDISDIGGTADRGGYARLATIINSERAAGHALFVHVGDTFSPSLLSSFDKGAHIVDILNQLQVDVFTPGNHEFDFGAAAFRDRLAEADFPVLSSNVFEADGLAPTRMVQDIWMEIEGIRIAFYGLTTDETPVISSPGTITFANPLATAVAKAAELRAAGADLVVALAHTPLNTDLALFRNNVADLILSGHDEHLMTYYNGTVALTESSAQAGWVVVTTLNVEKTLPGDGPGSLNWWPEFRIIDTADIEPDPAIAAMIADYTAQLDTELGVPVGRIAFPLDSRRATVMGAESSMGNLVADAMRAAVEADVAIVNGGSIRGDRLYPAGTELTRRDILTELPFDNRTLKLEVTGAQLLAALENGFSEIQLGAGRFPQISGIYVEVNTRAAVGNRVTAVRIGGRALVQTATYTLATNDFIAGGGDGYTILRNAPRLIDLSASQLATSQVIGFIENGVGMIPGPPRMVLR